ncbi:MAG: hypothetical protein HYR60_32355 [Acidobacteria bacterium]|nr:hypothetical protein [Acidobacteriota bacterium]MBI3471468.1 hypothetical protein [Candidatus Solibacter usitatus]
MKIYYQKIRELQRGIAEEYPVVMSLETPDGGKAGVATEVPRELAAKLVTDGRARLATEEEGRSFRAAKAEAKRAADQLAEASRVQLTVISESDLRALKSGPKK